MAGAWMPMVSAPRDGSEILAKLPRSRVFVRVAWAVDRWVSGSVPMQGEPGGWAPLDEGTIAEMILGDGVTGG